MALIATPGAANANSYLTLAEFNSYLATRLHVPVAVNNASNEKKEAALIMATRVIDAEICYIGIAASGTQSLSWPRTGMLSRNGYAIDSAVVPQQVKDATAELAFLLMQSDRTLSSGAADAGIVKLKAGSVQLQFSEGFKASSLTGTIKSMLYPGWICPDDANEKPVIFEMV